RAGDDAEPQGRAARGLRAARRSRAARSGRRAVRQAAPLDRDRARRRLDRERARDGLDPRCRQGLATGAELQRVDVLAPGAGRGGETDRRLAAALSPRHRGLMDRLYIQPLSPVPSPQAVAGDAIRLAGGMTYAHLLAVTVVRDGRVVQRELVTPSGIDGVLE